MLKRKKQGMNTDVSKLSEKQLFSLLANTSIQVVDPTRHAMIVPMVTEFDKEDDTIRKDTIRYDRSEL